MPVIPPQVAAVASTSPRPETDAGTTAAAVAAAAAAATKLAYKHQRYNQQLLHRWNSDRRSLDGSHSLSSLPSRVVLWSLLSPLSCSM